MSDRTTKVTLTAVVKGYVAGMERASQSTRKVTTDAQKLASQGDALKKMSNVVGVSLIAMGALAEAGVAYAVKQFAAFDAEMAQVQALSHATAGEMGELRDAALSVGQKFGYSATQVAQAETELIKAGISVKDIIGGALPGALTLAADGQMNVASATQIAAEAMTQFGLKGKDVPHISDLLAAGADKALGSVGDLGQALESGGLVANQFGLSIEETVGTLSAFAQSGLIGETAGTDLRQMLLKLANPSADAAKTMKQLGITLYDASGQFVGITSLSGQLNAKLGDTAIQSGKVTEAQKNQALATIFGSRAIAGANVLVANGAKGIQGWIDKVNDQGFAAQQAQGKLNSLQGDVQKLSAAFQTDLIKAGSGANVILRGLVKSATDILNAYGKLPPVVQQGVLWLGTLAGAATLGGGAFILAVPKIVEFRTALRVLAGSDIPAVARSATVLMNSTANAGSALSATAKFLAGPWGVALAAAVVGVDLLSKYLDGLQASSNEITNSLKGATSAEQIFATAGKGKDVKWLTDVQGDLKDLPAVLQASADQSANLFARFDSSHFGAFDALKQIGTQLAALAQNDLPAAQHAFSLLAEQTDGSQKELWRLLNTMPAYKDALTEQATAQGIDVTTTNSATNKKRLLKLATEDASKSASDSVQATTDAGNAYQQAANKAQDLDNELSTLIDTINKANGVEQDAVSANASYQDALSSVEDTIKNARDGVKGYSRSVNESTKAGADNAQMFSDLAKKSQNAAEAQYNVDHNTAAYVQRLQSGKKVLYDQILALTGNAKAAQMLADKVYAIPSKKEIQILTQKSAAELALQQYKAVLASIPSQRIVDIITRGTNGLPQSGGTTHPGFVNGAVLDFYANGGENHTAQIAPAGAWRVWAEPETGGEAYIPLAPSKRDRSLSIWQATGRRLGVQGFADGGITYAQAPPAYSSAAPTVTVSPMVSLKGATLLMSVDGRQMTAVINDQIVMSRTADTNTARRGSRGIL